MRETAVKPLHQASPSSSSSLSSEALAPHRQASHDDSFHWLPQFLGLKVTPFTLPFLPQIDTASWFCKSHLSIS